MQPIRANKRNRGTTDPHFRTDGRDRAQSPWRPIAWQEWITRRPTSIQEVFGFQREAFESGRQLGHLSVPARIVDRNRATAGDKLNKQKAPPFGGASRLSLKTNRCFTADSP